VLYGVLLFTGFETAANLGEETAHPKRDIPRAVVFAVLAIAGFYVIGAYAQMAGYGFSLDALGENAGAPLFGLAGPVAAGGFGSVLVRRVLEIVVILDMIAVMIGVSVAASRGFFAMARDRRLPQVLARVSGRGTPVAASTALLVTYVVAIAVTVWWTGLVALPGLPHYVAVFSWLSTFGSFSLGVIYLLMSVGAVRGLADHPKRWAVWLAATVGVAVTASAIFGSVYKVAAPIIYAPYVAVAVFVVGIVLAFLHPGRAPAHTEFTGLAEAERGPVRL
jgi:amino acid transporter